MGLSETIMAAMIGAIATVTAALCQLFIAWRARSKTESKPRRGMTTRSILAVLALMVASAAGGFLYSELIRQRTGEDVRAVRQELKDLRALLAEGRTELRTAPAASAADSAGPAMLPADLDTAADTGTDRSVESIVYVPACRRADAAGPCLESDAQRIALCGTIPSYARVDAIELFAQPDAVQHPWDAHRLLFEQDVGGARFTGNSFEYAQANDSKAVCVNFMHWSSEHPHIARILVRYGFGTPPAAQPVAIPASDPGANSPAIIAADHLPVPANAAAMASPVRVQ